MAWESPGWRHSTPHMCVVSAHVSQVALRAGGSREPGQTNARDWHPRAASGDPWEQPGQARQVLRRGWLRRARLISGEVTSGLRSEGCKGASRGKLRVSRQTPRLSSSQREELEAQRRPLPSRPARHPSTPAPHTSPNAFALFCQQEWEASITAGTS